MAINVAPTNKDEPTAGIAYRKALILLERHARGSRGYISFPECRRVLSHLYHLSKDEVFVFLGEMEEQGLCLNIPYHGIKINKEEMGKIK